MARVSTGLRLLVATGSLIGLLLALGDAMRYSSQEFEVKRLATRTVWLATLGGCFFTLLLLLGIFVRQPLGLGGVVWLLAMALVAMHVVHVRPEMRIARLHQRAARALP